MAYPSVTYTFTNGTTASATEVNQNFTDLINGLSDGTKDLSISALTVAGTASLNGAVNIGNATSDDIAVNGYITTALIPKADDSYDLGTAALAWQDAYFDGAVYTDTISELTGAAGVTIDETKLKDGGVILKTASEISDAGGKYVKIKGGDGSSAIGSGYNGERSTDATGTLSNVNVTNYTVSSAIQLSAGVWDVYISCAPSSLGDAVGLTATVFGFSTSNATTSAGLTQGLNAIALVANTLTWGGSFGPIRIAVSAATNYYFKQLLYGTSATTTSSGYRVMLNRVG
jgi:hypothetical protein